MEQLNMDDLLMIIGQKEAVITMLSRKVTALVAENQVLKAKMTTELTGAKESPTTLPSK